MKELETYRLSLKGLRNGINTFEYELGPTFFQVFKQQLINDAFINLKLFVDKRDELMILDMEHTGYMVTPCDRCLENIKLPLEGKKQLLVKFVPVGKEEDAEVIYLKAESDFFNPAPYMFEFIVLSIPMVRRYDCEQDEESPCSEEVLRHLKPKESEINSPIWEELKKLNLNLK